MDQDELEEYFKSKTGADSAAAEMYLNMAESTILAKTGRTEMISELYIFQLNLAICRYIKNGNEGLNSYNEAGLSENYMTEDQILAGINDYRLLHVARRYRKEQDES